MSSGRRRRTRPEPLPAPRPCAINARHDASLLVLVLLRPGITAGGTVALDLNETSHRDTRKPPDPWRFFFAMNVRTDDLRIRDIRELSTPEELMHEYPCGEQASATVSAAPDVVPMAPSS